MRSLATPMSRRHVLAAAATSTLPASLSHGAQAKLRKDIRLAADALAVAIEAEYPGKWIISVCPERDYVLIHRASD